MVDAIGFAIKSVSERTEGIASRLGVVVKQQDKTSSEMAGLLDAIRRMKEQARDLLQEQNYVEDQYKRVDKIVLSNNPTDYVIHEQPRKPKTPLADPELRAYQAPPAVTITMPHETEDKLREDFLSVNDEKSVALDECTLKQIPDVLISDDQNESAQLDLEVEKILMNADPDDDGELHVKTKISFEEEDEILTREEEELVRLELEALQKEEAELARLELDALLREEEEEIRRLEEEEEAARKRDEVLERLEEEEDGRLSA